MNNYQCKLCGAVVRGTSWPTSTGCPRGKGLGRMHDWKLLGDGGDTTYQCKKCGAVVYGKKNSWPRTFGCPSGGQHSWNKL